MGSPPRWRSTDVHRDCSNSCRDIPIKKSNVSLTMVLQEKLKVHHTLQNTSLGNHEYLYQILGQSIKQMFTYITSEVFNFWWHQRKSQRITKVLTMYPLGTLKISHKFLGNPFNSC